MANSGPLNPNSVQNSDRLEQLKEFDELKIGVKGLVDKGVTTIPSFFIHSKEPNPEPKTRSGNNHSIPVVDFSAPREKVVEQVHRASTTLGFFQIINHSVPVNAINRIVGSIKSFNEQNDELKMKYYSRDITRGSAYSTNFDLYNSKAASWRDTLQVRLAPTPPEWEYVPEVCREAVVEWDKEVVKIGEELMGLLCEGLGVKKERLKELSCLDGRVMAAHYYPYCPQPELTKGLTPHTDPGVLTVLVQNEMIGLQVKFDEDWVDLKPIPGAIVINIGDILQSIVLYSVKKNMSEVKYEVTKFNGDSGFSTWQRRMRNLPIQQGLHKALCGKSKKPKSMKLEDWEEIDERVASAIRLYLTDDVVNNIIDEESAYGIWTRLENLCMSKMLTNKLYLKKQLYALHMGEGTNFWSHLNVLNGLITELANLGVKIEEEEKSIALLNSLSSSYDNLVTTILHGRDSIELRDVTSTLLLDEKMRQKLENHGQTLITESRGRSYQRSSSNYGRSEARGKSKVRSKSKARNCYNCDQIGHFKKDCPNSKRGKGESSGQKNDDNTAAMVQNNDNVVLFINEEEECMHLASAESEWVVDTTSYHATPILSNDEYKSVEHRVLANSFQEPRVSVAIFFNPGQRENSFGPLLELISDEKPAVYHEFMYKDYMGRFFSKELDGKTLANYYRVSNQI